MSEDKGSEQIHEKVENIFPVSTGVPADYLFNIPVSCDHYLTGGRLLKWNGPVQDVFSPVYVKEGEKTEQKFIGTYPLLTEKEALQALAVAEKAFDHGPEAEVIGPDDRSRSLQSVEPHPCR